MPMLSLLNCKFTNRTTMKTPKAPTPLQLFKQWKKYNLAADKASTEKKMLNAMAYNAGNLCEIRITVDGFIYELTSRRGNYSWNADLVVTKLGSVEEFANLIK
jgi:hypothetical protein